MIPVRVGLDIAKRGADQFAGPQTGRIPEIQNKAQPLRRRWRPALRPFESIGEGANQQPFAFGEDVGCI